ncbi:hypothetical protein FH5_04822 [Priestia endophytica]|nr:hypothetical protein FH5_04822 [Priestia endophytica]
MKEKASSLLNYLRRDFSRGKAETSSRVNFGCLFTYLFRNNQGG